MATKMDGEGGGRGGVGSGAVEGGMDEGRTEPVVTFTVAVVFCLSVTPACRGGSCLVPLGDICFLLFLTCSTSPAHRCTVLGRGRRGRGRGLGSGGRGAESGNCAARAVVDVWKC